MKAMLLFLCVSSLLAISLTAPVPEPQILIGQGSGRPVRPGGVRPGGVRPVGVQPGLPAGGNFGGLVDILNGGQLGSASAGGAGAGNVVDNTATGVGTGVANAGPGGFGIGLGIGGAIATPLGNLAFGQGQSAAVGK